MLHVTSTIHFTAFSLAVLFLRAAHFYRYHADISLLRRNVSFPRFSADFVTIATNSITHVAKNSPYINILYLHILFHICYCLISMTCATAAEDIRRYIIL